MYVLIVRVEVKPRHRPALLGALVDVIDETRGQEQAAPIRFDVIQDSADPNCLFVYEVWRDAAAFDAHGNAPYYRRFGEQTAEWLVSPPTILCIGSNLFPPDEDERWR